MNNHDDRTFLRRVVWIGGAASLLATMPTSSVLAQRTPRPITPAFNQHATARQLPRPEQVVPRRIEPVPKRVEPVVDRGLRRPPEPLTQRFNRAAAMRGTRETAGGFRSHEMARTFNRQSGIRANRQIDLVTARSRSYLQNGQKPVILGTSGMYRPNARKVGGQYFWAPSGDFLYASRKGQLNPALRDQLTVRNKAYIERALAARVPILFAAPPGAGPKNGGYRTELGWLRSAVRSSNGALRYVKADVPRSGGGTRKIIIGVEATPRPVPTRAPEPRGPQ